MAKEVADAPSRRDLQDDRVVAHEDPTAEVLGPWVLPSPAPMPAPPERLFGLPAAQPPPLEPSLEGPREVPASGALMPRPAASSGGPVAESSAAQEPEAADGSSAAGPPPAAELLAPPPVEIAAAAAHGVDVMPVEAAALLAAAPPSVVAALAKLPDDVSVRGMIAPEIARLSLELGGDAPLRIVVRTQEGVADVSLVGPVPAPMEQLERGLRAVLAGEGLALGNLEAHTGQGGGEPQHEPPMDQAPGGPSPPSRAPVPTTSEPPAVPLNATRHSVRA